MLWTDYRKGITMEFRRAHEAEAQYFKYRKSIDRNTALIAIQNNEVLGTLEYDFKGLDVAEVTDFKISNDSKEVMNGLIEEFTYWHPFIRKLHFSDLIENKLKPQNNILHFKNACSLYKMNLEDIIPEQLTVSQDKIDKVNRWIKTPEDVVVCTVEIDDNVVCIDGYSRLISAYLKGFKSVYIYNDEVEDKSLYKACMSWCKADGIHSIEDLSKRIVSAKEHQRIWIDRCQKYLSNQRKIL